MKLSNYVYKVEEFNQNKKYIALYNSLTMDVAYITKDIYAQVVIGNLNKIGKNIKYKLIKNNLLVENSDYEKELFNKEKERISKISPTTLRLQLTDKCNLNCKYCQIERNYKCNNGINMSEDIAIRSLYLLKRFSPKNKKKTIIITGGEPLLNYNIILKILEESKKILENYRIVLFTNGTNITQRIAEKLKQYNVLVLFSIDGTEVQHNVMRKDFNNKGSFKKTIEGYVKCKKIGCKVGISGVVGKHNIENLQETLEAYKELEPASIGMNFPHYLLEGENKDLITMEEYTNEIIEIYKSCRKDGIYLENINRIIEPFVKKQIRGKECAALGRGITILPDGTVGPCKTLLVSNIIGKNIREIEKLDKLEDDKEFSKWNNRSTLTLKSCEKCIGIGLCGTGCTYDSYVFNKNIEGIDRRACVFTKKMIDFLINDLYSNIKERDEDVIIPTMEEREKIMGKIVLSENKIIESAGHNNLENI